jgi:zinc transporter ZupT
VTNSLVQTIVFSTIGGLGSVAGTFLVLWKEALVRRWSTAAISFAAGAMATTAFTHLSPEAIEASPTAAPLWTLAGFAVFFLLNQVVKFHACGRGLTHLHPIGTLALVGILVHSFFDGVAIGAGFSATESAGRVVTAAVFAHELPEGAFTVAILLHTGMSRSRALFWALIHGALTPIGAITAIPVSHWIGDGALPALLGLSAGTFFYVAAANLVPEAHQETSKRNALAFLVGIGAFLGVTALAHRMGLDHGHDHGHEAPGDAR